MTEQNKQSDTPAPSQHVDGSKIKGQIVARLLKARSALAGATLTTEQEEAFADALDAASELIEAVLDYAPAPHNPARAITDDHVDAFKVAFHGSYDGGRGENDYNKNIRLGLEASLAIFQTPEPREAPPMSETTPVPETDGVAISERVEI